MVYVKKKKLFAITCDLFYKFDIIAYFRPVYSMVVFSESHIMFEISSVQGKNRQADEEYNGK